MFCVKKKFGLFKCRLFGHRVKFRNTMPYHIWAGKEWYCARCGLYWPAFFGKYGDADRAGVKIK